MKAAKMALETGNANYVLIWVPGEVENAIKNLLEKTCCELITHKNAQCHIVDWYYETINRFHSAYCGFHNLSILSKNPDEKATILLVAEALETGNLEDLTAVIPDTTSGDI